MNTQESSRPISLLRNKAKRLVMFGVVAVSVSMLSMTGLSYANESMHEGMQVGMHEGMHGGPMKGMHGMHDPAKMAKHLDRMMAHLVPDLTDAQKISLKAITAAAATDMKAFHEQHKALRTAQMTILTAATVNRTALEQNRVDAMRLMEQMSKRKNLALADAADVLNASQRAKVAEILTAWKARHTDQGRFLKSPFGK